MNYLLTYDPIDPPPAGTACAQCKTAGHFCQARGYLGDDAVCEPCGLEKPCGRAIAITGLRTVTNEYGAVVASPKANERRCSDCRGKLGDQAIGEMCWPCRRYHKARAEAHARGCAKAREGKAAKRHAA
jgi:hypothetical protein